MAAIPTPKSPQEPPQVYGKRRQRAKVEVLEREIGFLQEELRSIEGVQPTSRCCQELEEFIESRPDPFISKNQNSQKPDSFWRKFWKGNPCCKSPRTCCCSRHSIRNAKCRSCYQTDDPKPQQQCCYCCCLEEVPCQKCCRLCVVSRSGRNSSTLESSSSKLRLCPSCVAPCCCSFCCQ